MAKGQSGWNSSEQEVVKYSNEPFKAGDYELKLLGDTVEIRKSKTSNKHYISLAFTALGSGQDGQKDRRVYHMLFLGLEPGKDGKLMPNRADQLLGFLNAAGDKAKFASVSDAGSDSLDARAVKKYLMGKDGDVVEGHIKIQKGTKDYPNDKNVVDYFIEASDSKASDEDEEDEELEDEEDSEIEDSEDSEDDEELEDDEDDEDEKKPSKVAKKSKKK